MCLVGRRRGRHSRRQGAGSLRDSWRAVPRRARQEASDEDRLAVVVPSQGARCRARSETAKTTRDGVRDARGAVVRAARGRVLGRGGGAVSPAPLWRKAWREQWRGCGDGPGPIAGGFGLVSGVGVEKIHQ